MQDQVDAPAAQRVALVAGATGLVGRAVLAALLTDKRYSAVHCLSRRAFALTDRKLVNHVVDFSAALTLPDSLHIDEVFIALGTTINVAGSQAAFRAVDFDAVLAVAKAARTAGAGKLGVVSAMGANVRSKVFYSRVKGEMEDALRQLGYPTLIIARPSLLAGDRAALAQSERLGEKLGLLATRFLKALIPANYRAIKAEQVAQALIDAMQSHAGQTRVLLSGEMQQFGH